MGTVAPFNLRGHYEGLYKTESSDSTQDSRNFVIKHLVMAMEKRLSEGESGGVVLDAASGRQSILGALRLSVLNDKNLRKVLSTYRYLSFDFAEISPRRQPQKLRFSADHIQADATAIPLSSDSVDFAVSNMALDFIGKDAYSEVSRVLKPGHPFVFTFHHPIMWRYANLENPTTPAEIFWSYLKDNEMLYSEPQPIIEALGSSGLKVEDVQLYKTRDSIDLVENWYWGIVGVNATDL